MEKLEMLKINKDCWDVVAPKFFGVESLPEYGPLTVTEDEIKLFDDINHKKVLDIGCGSGHSLKYMADNGAHELWGIDLSSTQIETAKQVLKDYNPRLFCVAMEDHTYLPQDYFDIVYSIYALGWTTDLPTTLKYIYSYLKKDGTFIFSWEHPIYPHVKAENNSIILQGSYQLEEPVMFNSFKGEQLPVILHRRKLETYINSLIEAGFKIERLIEGNASSRFNSEEDAFTEKYYSLYKTRMVPNTFIIKARK
ncbi:class I SAM-dependent methyltransferase [Bacillus sp. FJAT-49705]|uniref:Class I SAM-dependent methyltransferase n=1 Tax=Cytobacillus citreus TaxID=2833586 RepID=A0ABS5NWV6_9BACI|nr:class I SAM-dependent methyltransferase [Cytobacillus citreus]MBS4192081.1 class I SAM-dependent methyltransferase [Cytobacillus citreus]